MIKVDKIIGLSYPEMVRVLIKEIEELEDRVSKLEQIETDDETHNKNWEALIGDIQELNQTKGDD